MCVCVREREIRVTREMKVLKLEFCSPFVVVFLHGNPP